MKCIRRLREHSFGCLQLLAPISEISINYSKVYILFILLKLFNAKIRINCVKKSFFFPVHSKIPLFWGQRIDAAHSFLKWGTLDCKSILHLVIAKCYLKISQILFVLENSESIFKIANDYILVVTFFFHCYFNAFICGQNRVNY